LLEANGTHYRYDAAGNLSQKLTAQGEEWSYAWLPAGHLAEVVRPDGDVVRFTYDALGRRVSKSYRGRVTHWVWDGHKPLHEWTSLELGADNATELVTWLFEDDSFAPVGKLQGQAAYSVVTDHLGTPLQLHDGQGHVAWATELNSYGQRRVQTEPTTACPFRYQGQYEDQETGLYYNRFRYYDPESGAYISQDPIGLLGGMSLYSYVLNTSTFVDPFGLSCQKPDKLKFSAEGVSHVKKRHISSHPDWEHKSKWTVKNGGWRAKTRDTFKNPDKVTRDGDRFIFQKEYKNPVGIDRDGNSLYKVRVVTEKDGEIVTSFPQLDWK
jgi:RHS repeat-associated protein